MYRPTVRYSDTYKDHINDLFRSTTLDRNQILRLALHVAAHSNQFNQILSRYQKGDVPLPSPVWEADDHGLWMENNQQTEERGEYVNANLSRDRQTERVVVTPSGSPRPQATTDRCEQPIKRREGEISSQSIRVANQGGIKFDFGTAT